MKNGKDNAFPVVLQHGLSHDSHVEIGLTKREYFAIMAMQGYIAAGSNGMPNAQALAGYATNAADALLAELEKTETT